MPIGWRKGGSKHSKVAQATPQIGIFTASCLLPGPGANPCSAHNGDYSQNYMLRRYQPPETPTTVRQLSAAMRFFVRAEPNKSKEEEGLLVWSHVLGPRRKQPATHKGRRSVSASLLPGSVVSVGSSELPVCVYSKDAGG